MNCSRGTEGMTALAAYCDTTEDALADMIVLALVTGSLAHVNLCLFKGSGID